NTEGGWVGRRLEVGLQYLGRGYEAVLGRALHNRKTVLALAVATLLPAVVLLGLVKADFMPLANEGRISVSVDVPAGVPKPDLMQRMARIEAAILAEPAIDSVLTSFRESGSSGT